MLPQLRRTNGWRRHMTLMLGIYVILILFLLGGED